MPMFGFQDRFIDAIVRGTKRSTIRRTQRAKVGDTCNLYARLRTKGCLCLATVEIECVEKITIGKHRVITSADNPWKVSTPGGYAIEIYLSEGFASWEAMRDFFDKQYGLPFHGYFHRWKPIERYCDDTRLAWCLDISHPPSRCYSSLHAPGESPLAIREKDARFALLPWCNRERRVL